MLTYARPRASFQTSAMVISQSLTSVSQHLNAHRDLFASMSVFPLPEFPGKTQENLLGQLLRKKLEPSVEDWVTEGRDAATAASNKSAAGGGSGDHYRRTGLGLSNDELVDLWDWAGMAANQEAREHAWGGNYTLEEKEAGVKNVVTGLRRRLREDPDEESSDEDDDDEGFEDEPDGDVMEIVGSQSQEFEAQSGKGNEERIVGRETSHPLPIDDVFRFLMKGSIPTG